MAGNLVALAGGTAAWVVALFQGQSPLQGLGDINTSLAPLLSPEAAVWLPGTEGYASAMDRWTPRKNPSFDVVVDVATEEDVAHTVRACLYACLRCLVLNDVQVRYANANERPFLAISGKHGNNNYAGKVKRGVGINLRKLNSVEIGKDGRSATIGGGIVTKELIDALWEDGKMSSMLCLLCLARTNELTFHCYIATGCCECTGAVAPMLGGGHGWLQGK